MRRAALSLLALSTAACADDFDAWPMAAGAPDLDPLELPSPAFAPEAPDDRDGDCMSDHAEHLVAERFRPLFVFDSRERARRDVEPVLFYQATPSRPRGPCGEAPARVEVTWAYLLRDDGGYVASGVCGDAHPGDNQYVRALFDVRDRGRRLALASLTAWGFTFPRHAMRVRDRSHPVIYLSAGRHHPYFDTRVDGHPSPYSRWGCVEASDGLGDAVLGDVESEAAPRRWHNVGERDAHPREGFVGDLGAWGFTGEDAWGAEPFCGGRPRSGCSDSTNPMRGVWR